MARATSAGTCLAETADVRARVPVPIVLVMSRFEPGGTEHQMIELARRLDRTRWTVHLAVMRSRGAWVSRAAAAAPITVFPLTSFHRPHAWRQGLSFARWCRREQIAVVHATDMPSNIFALPAAALAGVPLRIGNRRELVAGRSRLDLVAQRTGYTCAHIVIANSHAAATRLQVERVPAEKIRIVPNGIDSSRFPTRDRQNARRRVVCVANLRSEKAHDVLIDAAAFVLQRFPDAHFELIGGGPERSALVERARTRGVLDRFSFAGHCEDVAERLAAADLFVLPSRSESFPNSVLEAMAAALPIVASRVGGICELIDDGHTGWLVPPDDPVALANGLAAVMADAGLARRLGDAARATAASRYSFDRMVVAFDGIYQSQVTRLGIAEVQPLQPSPAGRWKLEAGS